MILNIFSGAERRLYQIRLYKPFYLFISSCSLLERTLCLCGSSQKRGGQPGFGMINIPKDTNSFRYIYLCSLRQGFAYICVYLWFYSFKQLLIKIQQLSC